MSAVKLRPRCACGKVRRQKAEACQDCLNAAEAARRAAEPPTRWARDWRQAGWLCAFVDGFAVIVPRLPGTGSVLAIGSARATPIDRGAWSLRVDFEDWRRLPAGDPLAQNLSAIARDCYCSSFPDTGCDFCNGTRLPDGAKVSSP